MLGAGWGQGERKEGKRSTSACPPPSVTPEALPIAAPSIQLAMVSRWCRRNRQLLAAGKQQILPLLAFRFELSWTVRKRLIRKLLGLVDEDGLLNITLGVSQ